MGFQRGHLPHPDRGPPHPSLPRSRGRVREGATRRCPQWRKGGIEEQTRKLFEVCRLRDVPIITFVNKLDRESRDPFDLLERDRAFAGARRQPGLLADLHGGGGARLPAATAGLMPAA
jgi:hypothetical protein